MEASTSARMLLAGLLLKLGTGGFIRFLKILNLNFFQYFFILSFLGIIVRNFFCLVQRDLKALAAYSSINHISFVLLIFGFISIYSFWCRVLIILSHGLISILIFFFIGEFYHRRLTRINYYYSRFFLNSLNLSLIITLV